MRVDTVTIGNLQTTLMISEIYAPGVLMDCAANKIFLRLE
jgi:hypothetical protein